MEKLVYFQILILKCINKNKEKKKKKQKRRKKKEFEK